MDDKAECLELCGCFSLEEMFGYNNQFATGATSLPEQALLGNE